jgi:hypothetical protein
MTNKKTYQPMKIVKLGNLDELTELGLGKSGSQTDGMNNQGNMMN